MIWKTKIISQLMNFEMKIFPTRTKFIYIPKMSYLFCWFIIILCFQMSIIDRIEKLLPRKKINIFGQEKFIRTSIPFYVVAFVTSLVILIHDASPFMFLAIAHSFFPIMDEIFSLDSSNPSYNEKKELIGHDNLYVAPLYAAIINYIMDGLNKSIFNHPINGDLLVQSPLLRRRSFYCLQFVRCPVCCHPRAFT